jgi:hypothetical protein
VTALLGDKQSNVGSDQPDEQTGLIVSDLNSLIEDETPEAGLPVAIISPDEYVKVSKWKVNRVFYFLSFTSLGCLSAVVLRSTPVVETAASTIFVSSAALAWRLLSSAYNGKKRQVPGKDEN